MQIQRHSFKWILYGFLCWMTSFVQAQTPTLTNATPAEGFIGEQVCFPVTFVNTGAPGYGPYVRLIVPTGFTFDNASFGGSIQTVQNLGVIVSGAPNNFVIDPIAQSNSNSTTNDTIFAPVGSTVILLEYPVGSMVQGGVSLISEVCMTVDPAATIGVPVDICTQGVYEFGDTPTGDNGPIAGANECEPIIPILFRFDKKVNGSDGVYNEVPGGGASLCHIHQYELNIDIAAAGTLNGPITITDVLPGELAYLGNISLPAGCSAVEPTVGGLGGTLTVTCNGSYPGSTANIDMQVTFDAAVSDTLDETICDDTDINNGATVNVPGNPSQSDTVVTHVEHVLLGHTNNTVSPVTIGQTVLYTIGAEITEYTAGLTAASITFIVPDGMIYNPASLTWAGTPVAAGNVVIVPGPGTGSTVTVDVHTQNGANILPCASPSLQYTADVNQTYANGDPVLSRDRLTHSSTLTYDLVEGATGCTTSAGTPIDVIDIFFQKTVNNSPPTGPGRNGQWWPGDVVQYRLELQIPSLDLDDVVITDFFPLPIHDVASLAATFGTDVRFDPATCWNTAPVTYTRDIPTNSLILDFGDVSDLVTGGCVDIVLLIDIPITTLPFADGLFHSNFMQVNSDNSTADDITSSVLTLIQVGAPDLELTKGIVSSDNPNVTISPTVVPPDGNATDVSAGDQLFFDITIENVGGAPGYDVQVRDVAPPELTNCALVAPNPVVDGSNNALAFSGGFVGNALTIDLVAPNDSIAFATAPNNNDLITVSYVCEAVAGIQAGTRFDNTAEVDWSSTRGGVKFPPVEDDANGRIADPTMNKVVDYIFPNYSNTNTQASIGEVVAYELQLNIPEGNMNNVTLVDQVDEGLAFVAVDSIVICNSSGSTNIITSIGGGFPAVQSGATITNLGANPQQQDRVLTLDFGNLQNLDTDNIEDTIKVYYRTIVINHVTNFDGERVRNRAVLSWDNPNTPGDRSSINDRAPFVTIVEPQLEISKSFTPDEVLPGNNSFVTLTVRNPGTSSAPAFDVSLTDILPTGMTFVSGFSAGGTASITTPPTNGGGTITAHWDTINVGEVYSITFEVQASSSITPCFTLTNCANLVWESIAEADEPNMPTAFSSNLGVQRTGNPGNLGGAANTYTQDSCADLDVVIDNTFDPFITANTPLCEGDRVVLTVQQYQGNVVRYNWTGPGVPAGFNNYELVLDPVTTADTGTYFVYVELDGCITDTSNFFSLQLRPKPVTPNINPGDTTICEGTSIQFSTSTIANNYTWTGPNGFTANSATTPLISPVTLADAGRYTLFTTNAQGCNSDPISSNLTVTPRPAQPSIASNTPICSNENIILTSSTSAITYQWMAPNGQDTITTNNTLTLEPNNPLYTAGNWTLVVFDANGCASQPSTAANVIINGTPIAPMTSNSGPICEGEDVTLMVNTVSSGTYAWYSDANLTNLVASTQNPVISGLLASNSPDTFYVQVSSNGCLSDTGFTVVQVNPNPAAVSPGYTPLCSGDTIFLFANATANIYNWTGPNGFVSNLENPFIANSAALNAGSYTVSITDANGCSNSGIVQVAVDERPVTPTITGNGPVCEGDNIQLNIGSYTGTTVQYTWSTPTGVVTTGVPSLNINNTTVADSGLYSVVVAVDGCTSLADSINIVVRPNPIAPNVPSNFSVCEGDGIALTTTTNANIYNWTGPNGFSSNSPNPTVISPASSANAGTYTLVVQDFNGCTSPAASTVVTVNAAPAQPSMTTNSPICNGADLVMSTSAVGNSYIWRAPNGADTTTASSTLTIVPTSSLYQSGNWTLSVVNAAGCVSPASIASAVEINSIPSTASAGNNGPVCRGTDASLSAGTVSGASYAWYTDAGTSNQFSTLQNPTVNNLTNDSTFYLLVTVNGCPSALDSTTVVVYPLTPSPSLPADFAVCEGDDIALSTSTVASSYDWSGPNGFTSNAQNPVVITNATGSNAGVYTLSIVDGNGCSSADTSVQVTVNAAPTQPSMTTNSPICNGADLVMSTSAAGNSYIWRAPNGADTTTASSTLTIVPTSSLYQSGNWTLSVVNAAGCVSPASIASAVEINSIPSTASAGNNGPVCRGTDASLSAGTVSGASYAWYTDAGTSNQFSTLQNPTVNNLTNDSTFYLLVTVNGCPSALDSTTVVVYPLTPSPSLPADFAVCEGDDIALSTSTVASSYDWSGPNGFTSNAQNPVVITNATGSNAGVYTLSIVDGNGCSSADTSVQVTVNAAPTQPSMTTNSPICNGADLVMSTSAVGNSYIWRAPNGADTTTASSTLTIVPTSSLYQSGNWTLSVVNAAGCVSPASIASAVEINSIPSTASAGNNGPVCTGTDASLSAGTVSGASYAWYTDAGTSNQFSTLQNPTVNNLTNDSTFYLLVTVNGCPSALDSTTVVVYPLTPSPSLPADFAVCEGDDIALSTSTVASSYDWSGPNGFTSNAQNPVVITNATGSNAGVYTLSIVDGNGCSSADTSVQVTVNAAPTQPSMTTNSPICNGADLVMSTSAAGNSYIWRAPNGADTTTASSTLTIVPTSSLYQSGNWTLSVVNAAGCVSPASVVSMVTINNGTNPTAFNNGPVCRGDAVQLNTTTINNALYEWYSDAALTNLISTQQNPTVANITTDSTFYLVVTVNGCPSSAVATTVTLHPTPATPNIPANFVVCEGETIALSTSTVASSYNWTGPNGFTSNLQNPAVIQPATTADAGSYTLFIVDANGCQSADTSVVVGVNRAPAAPVLTNNSAICDGDTLLLSTTASADTFRWISPNGIDTITTVNSLMIVPTNGTYYQSGDWTLITQVANNCPSEPSAPSSVVINSSTAAPTAFNDGPVCVGGDVTLSTPSAPGAFYQWYTDAALTNLVATTASFTAINITQDSTFYLVVTVNGCTSPAGSTVVNVIGQPSAPNVPADFEVCEGDDIILGTTTIAASYSWTGPNGFTSNLQNPAAITNASLIDSGIYRLVVTYSNGCVSADTTVRVGVNSNPPVPNIVSNGPICFGDTLVLSSSTSCGQSQWIGPNGNSQSTLGTPGGSNVLWTIGSTTSIPMNNANYLPGNWYMICIDTVTGCRSESNTINVIINANPDTPAVFNDGPVCEGGNSNLSTATVSGASYAWYSDSSLTSLVSTAQNPMIVNISTDTTWYLVVTVNGCSSVAGSTTVIVHPTPAIPNVPANFAVCEGDNITLSTSTVASGYNWSGPNGFTSNVQNPVVITNATTSNAGVYTLSIIDGNGCESGDTAVTVTVDSIPATPVLSSNSAICSGDTLELSTTALATSYEWIAPDGSRITTGTSILSISSNNSLYQSGDWMLVTTNASGCTSMPSSVATVVINANPAQPAVFNDGPVCEGGNSNLSTATVSGASYAWYSDSSLTSLVSTAQNPMIVNISTDTTWYLVVTVNGCSSVAGSTTVIVHPTPATPNVPANFAVCEGDNITLSTSTVASSYNWSGPNGFTSNVQNPVVIANATTSNAGVYTLSIVDGNGCESGDTTVTVTVDSIPVTPVLSSNSAICFGDTLELSTTALATSYEWIAPDGSRITTGTNILSISSNNSLYQSGDWMLVTTNASGCTSMPSSVATVVINANPAQPAVFNDGPVCEGGNSNLSTATVSGASYAWYSDSSLTSLVSTAQNPMIVNISTDTTWYLVVTVNGCSSVAGSTTVIVHPTPATPNVPANFAVCEGDNITLSTSTVASGYNWSGPNGFTSNVQNPVVITNATASNAGVYTLSIVDGNGCESGDTTVTVTVNGNPPVATITSNSPICFGDTLTLSSSTNCGQSQWIGPNGNSSGTLGTPGGNNVLWTIGSTTNIPSTDVNYLSGDWYMICIDTITGCRSESNTITIEINPIPVVSAFNNGPICAGEDGELSATFITGASYRWYSDATLTTLISTSRTPIISSMMSSETYYVVATINGCTSLADSTTIVVNPTPVIPNPTYTPLCQLDTLFLQANAVGPIATYWWTGPNGFTSHLENPVIPNIYPFNAGSYILTVTDSLGCEAVSTVEVTIYPKPQTPTIAHNAPFCEGTNDLTLTTQAYFGTDVRYIWTLPNGNLDTTFVPSLVLPNATVQDTGAYSLVVWIDGCLSLPAEEIIRIYPTPATPNVPADFAVCEGEAIVLTTTTNATSYFWTGPNGFQSNLQSPSVVNATLVDAGSYHLYVTNTWGCQSLDTSVQVTVNANPPVATITSNSPICFGDTLTLSSSTNCGQSQWIGPNGNSTGTLGTPGGNNVLWTIGSTTNIPSTDSNYLSGDWYMICIDTITGCRSESNTITIDINPIPSTPAAFNNGPICIGGTAQLSTTTVSGATYAWYADATLTTLVATNQNPTISNITTDSTFYIVVTVNGCSSLAGSTTVSTYPVPATPAVPADFAVCEGDNIVLSTTTVAAGYNWTGPNGFTSNLQNPSVVSASLVDSGTYTLFIIDANGCPSGDTSVQVSVHPNPVQPVLSSNSAICDGDSLVLSTTATATTYRWVAPDGADTLTTVNTLVILPSNAFYQDGNWTLMTMDANGCQSILSNPESVTIHSIPAAQAVFNNGPVCRGSSVNLSTSFISGATYEWYADAALTILVATSQNPTINNITTDSTFYLVITVNGCTSAAGATTVVVHPTPTTPNVPSNITVCEGDAIVLTTTTNASAYVWSGPNGFSSNQQSPTVINAATVVDSGRYSLYVIDANGCRSEDTSLQVVVNPTPTTPLIVSNNTPICEGSNIVLSANAGAAGTTYEWFNASNVSVGTGQTLTIVGATVADAGDYYVVTTLNSCSSAASSTTTAIVDQVPSTAAFAGNDINLCNSFTTTLDATPPSSATGFWTTNSGATIANPNLANSAVYNLPTGTSTFYWTLSNGACIDFSVDSMVVDVTPASTDVADAGLDQNLCGQTSATLTAANPSTATGQWTQSASQAGQGIVITNPTNPNTTVTGLQQGNNYTFTWTLSNGNCTDYSTDMVQINVDVSPPDNAYAGVDILLCNQNTANLDAFVSQYGTGMWTSTSSATIIDPTLANTTVINLPQDTSVFVWTLSNGTCQNYSTDSVLVVVSTTTDTAEAGNNQVVCSVNALTLGATMPSSGFGTWSQTAAQAAQGVVIVDVNDPNTQVVGLNAGTTYAFTWTLSNGTCQDYSSDVTTISVNATPPDNAFAGNDINLCGVATTTNLAASVPTVAMGLWTTTSSATISNPTQPNSTVSGLSAGQNIFIWTLSNGTCQDYDSDTVIVTVTTPSSDVADAGLDSAYCAQSVVTLNAVAPSVGGGYWSQTPSQASLGAVIDNPTDTATTVSNLMPGVTYTFTWTLTNGGCVDYSSDQVLITIDVLPTNVAYAGEDTILCGGNAVQLDGLAPPIGTGFWTTNDTATIVTPVDPNSLVVNIAEDTTTYYWTLSNGACVDYSVDSVTVIISPASTDLAFAGYDEVLCGVDSIILSAAVPTTSTGIWTQSAGQASQGIVITNPTNPNSSVTGIQAGQVYTFTWTLSTFGCANFSTDDVQYTINALPPEVAYAGPDIVLCTGNSVTMDANNPIFSTGVWSSNSSAVIVNPTLSNSNIVNIPTDTVAFYWSLSNGSCADYSIDTMLIIVTPTFSVDTANAGLDINLCNEDTAQLMAIAPNVATGRWTQPFNQSSAGVVITDPNAAMTTATGLQLDSTYTFTWSVSNGPCRDYDRDQVIVQVSTLPTDAAYAGEDFVICGIDTAIVSATAPSIGTGMWTTTTTATIVTPPSTRTELLNLSLGSNEFIWTLSNGACRDYSSDTIVITMDSAPIANADSFVVIYNSNGNTIDVTPNDGLNNNWVITISESIASGTLDNLGTGEFDLFLQDVLVDQRFIYQLCNPNCPAIYCDTALVTIDVQGGTECNFPNMITPNNDDANETFIVPCLDGLEGTKFAVYNRWGDLMYENDNYKNDWGGTHNGVPVPDATYFYIMELADGQRFQGFVEVRR